VIQARLSAAAPALLVFCLASGGAAPPRAGAEEGTTMGLTLTSTAFKEGGDIPGAHTCDGADRSPALAWSEPPPGTKALALICDDPDAPAGTWVHWVLYDLPADARGLPEGVLAERTLASGAKQGTNDFGRIGYGGPCPPRGPAHRYLFKLYALDSPAPLAPGARKAQVEASIKGHVLGEAKLMGRYRRAG
jgi:Raf kinase inhibitor-like YbhB/YbcL family protein